MYNLSVEGCPEFFAGGILVHNCDSTRFITAEWGPGATPLSIEERIQRQIDAELGPRDQRPGDQRPADPLAIGPSDGRNFGRLMMEADLRRKIEEEETGAWGSFWDGTS